eukprot:gene13471-9279_t
MRRSTSGSICVMFVSPLSSPLLSPLPLVSSRHYRLLPYSSRGGQPSASVHSSLIYFLFLCIQAESFPSQNGFLLIFFFHLKQFILARRDLQLVSPAYLLVCALSVCIPFPSTIYPGGTYWMQVGVLDDGPVCQYDGCGTRDLLSAGCQHCHRNFCSEHILLTGHQCPCAPDLRVPRCPICNTVVTTSRPGESIDEAVSRHIDNGCRNPQPSRPLSAAAPGQQRPASAAGRIPQNVFSLRSTRGPHIPGPYQSPPVDLAAPSKRVPGTGRAISAGIIGAPTTASGTLQKVLRLAPANTATTPIGLPVGKPIAQDECWVPLVHVLLSRSEGAPGLAGGAAPASTITSSSGTNGVMSATHSQAPTPSFYLIPPMYVYSKRSFTLGKVLDVVVTEVELRNGGLSAVLRRQPPRFLFLVPQHPPEEAQEGMYPPQPLSGLVGSTVWASGPGAPGHPAAKALPGPYRTGGGRTLRDASLSLRAVVFLSDKAELPAGLLQALRRSEQKPAESTCLPRLCPVPAEIPSWMEWIMDGVGDAPPERVVYLVLDFSGLRGAEVTDKRNNKMRNDKKQHGRLSSATIKLTHTNPQTILWKQILCVHTSVMPIAMTIMIIIILCFHYYYYYPYCCEESTSCFNRYHYVRSSMKRHLDERYLFCCTVDCGVTPLSLSPLFFLSVVQDHLSRAQNIIAICRRVGRFFFPFWVSLKQVRKKESKKKKETDTYTDPFTIMFSGSAHRPESGATGGSQPPQQQAVVSCPSAKVVVVGESAVGKSAIAWRFCRGDFEPQLESTVGAAFMWRVGDVSEAAIYRGRKAEAAAAESGRRAAGAGNQPGRRTRQLKYEIWDTAGQERYRSLVPVYYRSAAAAFIVYDITDRRSFERSVQWIHELRQNVHSNDLHMVLLGNKSDLSQRQVSAEEGEKVAQEEGLAGFLETSAKENRNIDAAFELIGGLILASRTGESDGAGTSDSTGVRLGQDAGNGANNAGWGCGGLRVERSREHVTCHTGEGMKKKGCGSLSSFSFCSPPSPAVCVCGSTALPLDYPSYSLSFFFFGSLLSRVIDPPVVAVAVRGRSFFFFFLKDDSEERTGKNKRRKQKTKTNTKSSSTTTNKTKTKIKSGTREEETEGTHDAEHTVDRTRLKGIQRNNNIYIYIYRKGKKKQRKKGHFFMLHTCVLSFSAHPSSTTSGAVEKTPEPFSSFSSLASGHQKNSILPFFFSFCYLICIINILIMIAPS